MTNFKIQHRILMFAVISAMEYDLRQFLRTNPYTFKVNENLYEKVVSREKKKIKIGKYSDDQNLLDGLDIGDLVSLIESKNVEFEISLKEKTFFHAVFNKIIPIRNKVMHTKPIDFSDRGTVEEAMHTLDTEIPSIEWAQLVKIRNKYLTDPNKLVIETEFIPELDNSTSILHNLPRPEFDDTGFIGRKQESKDLSNLIESDQFQIITVVGNGGIGKTALVLKCLYDILEKDNSKFDAIVWISLKTRTLSRGEFTNIQYAIQSLDEMYESLNQKLDLSETESVTQILEFMKEFPVLLVIDNLETIPTIEIIEFLKKIPEKSKVLISSRMGLGELEYKFPLDKMKIKDARNYFISLSKYYQLDLHEVSTEIIDSLILDHLYSSPLSIKWYITGIYYGTTPESLISNKDELVEFAMSNIIEKLTSNQIKILWLLFTQGKNLAYGEIDYFLEIPNTQLLIKDINTLNATSMIKLLKGSQYELNNMAKDYLNTYRPPTNEFMMTVSKKKNELNSLLQEIKTKNETDPFNPKSIYNNLNDENTKIASIHLSNALKYSLNKEWINADELIQRAEDIAPNYFEVYKIKAFINAENNNLSEANISYTTALENAPSDNEKASVYYLFSVFQTNKLKDYTRANELIDKAIELANDPILQLEKARVLMYLGQFDGSETMLKNIDMKLRNTDKFKNQYYSKYSDLYRRKANEIDNRDILFKFEYLKRSIMFIGKLDRPDYYTISNLVHSLQDLTYILHYEPALELFILTYNSYHDLMIGNKSGYIKGLKKRIDQNSSILPDEIVIKSKLLNLSFQNESKKIEKHNEGIITKLTDSYGFLENKHDSFYFKVGSIKYKNPSVGDYVKFVLISGISKDGSRWSSAADLDFIDKSKI